MVGSSDDPPPAFGVSAERAVTVQIHPYDPAWPNEFYLVAGRLRDIVRGAATRIDHIGSTSVPGLDAKDVIDIQVSVADANALERASGELARGGWVPLAEAFRDHPVPGLSLDPSDWEKRFFSEPAGTRRVNVHVRVEGRPNQRYPLLLRDYLRAHPSSAQAYATLKRHLAEIFPDDSARYADVKDPACDLIYFAAEQWSTQTGWAADPSRSVTPDRPRTGQGHRPGGSGHPRR